MAGQQRTANQRPRLPTGWRRRMARLPILFYRMGLGVVFGKRLLLLHHVGRVSGLERKVVLEVVAHEPKDGSWTVASGFGAGADWYRNLKRSPKTLIRVGNRLHAVTAHFLTAEEGGVVMARYGSAHPRVARRLCAFMGFPVDGGEESFRRAGERIPFVRLVAAPGRRLP